MSSPWAKISTPEATNLQDIIAEEVAKELQIKEDKKYVGSVITLSKSRECGINLELLNQVDESASNLDADTILAWKLQQQFDEEYVDMLKHSQNQTKDISKISISFNNYDKTLEKLESESDSEEEEEIEDFHDPYDWDEFDTVENVTVHSPKNTNINKSSLPSEFHTGGRDEYNMKLPNTVYNSLRLHSKHEQSRTDRVHDKKEDQATAEFSVDEFTRLQLYKMISNRLLERVNGVISVGKEAVVLHADSDPTYPHAPLPKKCAVKVFKTTLAEFKQREKYIREDKRFIGRVGKQYIRNTIHLWAEKEMRNLFRLQKAGIPCPEVVKLRKHILVMSFIGSDHHPAPKLKDARLKADEYVLAYNQVVEAMKTIYNKARLIHADLSEYNILWYNKQCYFIDVSQSVEPSHMDAFQFLKTDCDNITNFFTRKGVPNVKTSEDLFIEITGCDYRDKVALEALSNAIKIKPHMVGKCGMEPYDSFEATWQKVNSEYKRLPSLPVAEVFRETENPELINSVTESTNSVVASASVPI